MKDERIEFVATGPLIYRLTFSTETPPPFRIQATLEPFYYVIPSTDPVRASGAEIIRTWPGGG